MKKIILLELVLLIMGTTFKGDNQQGWYIQPIPVNKSVLDIYFIDTLNGWAVTDIGTAYDTSFCLKTTNGGDNWVINYSAHAGFYAIQFTDINTGYICGGIGIGVLYKTTNGGTNWNQVYTGGHLFNDLYFLNSDTGWVCDDDGAFGIGLLKTTNGGINWAQQMDKAYKPKKMFFLNKDTGWVITDNRVIYRTNNSGNNWFLTSDLNPSGTLRDLFFTSSDTGWIIRQNTGTQRDSYIKTINGGYNWQVIPDLFQIANGSVPSGLYFINSNYGYIGTLFLKIIKTVDGINWGQQEAPAGAYSTMFFTDSLKGWVSQYYQVYNIAATKDGGGPIMHITNNKEKIAKDYILEQNYPNPFNQSSIINYKCSIGGIVKISVYDLTGKEIALIVNEYKPPGNYTVMFDARHGGSSTDLPSGIYFYSLIVDGIVMDTKKAIHIK